MAGGNSISKTLVWILMGLLIIGLGGFGVTNLSGNVHSVGNVGDARIDLQDYARSLQREIRALEAERREPVSFAQARAEGLDQAVLARLVTTAALDHETGEIGISIGDENLREQIVDIPAFQGISGGFDREAYSFTLEQSGLSEAEFEQDIRQETARTLVQAAVVSGVSARPAHTDTLLRYLAERRSITWATLDRTDLVTGLPEPTDADLRAYHQSHLPDFTSPERKRITYAWLTPDMIVDSVDVDETALREAYDARRAEFNLPERRLVERLAFRDEAAAREALSRIAEGQDFAALVEARGLTLADVDLGDVTRADLGAAAEQVFAAAVGDVVGPAESPVGPSLFRINAILAAQSTSFEDALPQLRDNLAADRARRVVDSQIDSVDDLLAGGATLEDVARETDMRLGDIDWHPGMSEGIAAYDSFRRAAATLAADDYPDVMQMEDAGIFALRLDEVVEPEIMPLEEVRDAVARAWRQQATVDALRTQAEGHAVRLKGGAAFEDLGLGTASAEALTRRGFEPDTPPDFVETVFDMSPGEVRLLDGEGRLFILRLDAVQPPDENDADVIALRDALNDQISGAVADDLFRALAEDIRARAGVSIDQAALNAVHANFN